MEIDELDKKILNTLIENSRLSYRQIAQKLKKSAATIMHRINNLEKENIIKKYTTEIDYDKLGYDLPVIIELNILKGRFFEIEKKIAKHPNVSVVYDTTGDFDATMIARFKTRRAMDTFIKDVQTYDFIQNTSTKLILNTIKEENTKV